MTRFGFIGVTTLGGRTANVVEGEALPLADDVAIRIGADPSCELIIDGLHPLERTVRCTRGPHGAVRFIVAPGTDAAASPVSPGPLLLRSGVALWLGEAPGLEHAELEAAARASTPGSAPWRVYADWLAESGDVTGAWLQRAEPQRPPVGLATFLRPDEAGRSLLSLELQHGVLTRASIDPSRSPAVALDCVRALLRSPCARFLHQLDIELLSGEGDSDTLSDVAPVLELLAAGRFAFLRTLHLGHAVTNPPPIDEALFTRVRASTALRLRASDVFERRQMAWFVPAALSAGGASWPRWLIENETALADGVRVTRRSGRYDLWATREVLLNGHPRRAAILRDGDVVELDGHQLRFEPVDVGLDVRRLRAAQRTG